MVKKNEIFVFQRMLLLSITIFLGIGIFNYFLNDNKKIETFVDDGRNERIRRFQALTIDPDEDISDDNLFTKILNEPFQNSLQAVINDAGDKINEATFKSNINQLQEESHKIIKNDVILNDYFEKIYFRYRYVPKENVVLLFPSEKIELNIIKDEIMKLIPSMIDRYVSEVRALTEEQKNYAKNYLETNLEIYLKVLYQFNQPNTSITRGETTNQMMFPEATTTQPQTTKPKFMPDLEINEAFIFGSMSNNKDTIEKDNLISYLNYNEIDTNDKDNSIIQSIALEPTEDINNKVNPKYIFIEIRYKLNNFSPKIDKLLKRWHF